MTAGPDTASELVRSRIQGTWAFRTRAEIEASARFARVANELQATGAEPVVVNGVRAAAEDEARHRDLCAEVAARWGVPDARRHVAPRTRIGRDGMDERDRVLWEMCAVCCISETMNAALLTRCFEVAKEPQIRATIHELLKDEVKHSRLGWAHLSAERAAGRGAFLSALLPLMLDASVEPGFLDGTQQLPWSDELYDYGELPLSELVQLYCDVLQHVVFPGFEALGVDASQGRAWLDKQAVHAQSAGS